MVIYIATGVIKPEHAPSWWKFTRKGIRSIPNDKSHVPKSTGEL